MALLSSLNILLKMSLLFCNLAKYYMLSNAEVGLSEVTALATIFLSKQIQVKDIDLRC